MMYSIASERANERTGERNGQEGSKCRSQIHVQTGILYYGFVLTVVQYDSMCVRACESIYTKALAKLCDAVSVVIISIMCRISFHHTKLVLIV